MKVNLRLSAGRIAGLKRLSVDAGFTASSQIVATLAAIGLQILLARSVDLAVFGQIAAAQALVVLVEGALTSRGAETALQVMGAHWKDGPSTLKALARHLLIQDALVTGSGFVLFAIFGGALAHLFGANTWIVVALACAIPLQINFGVRKNLFLLNNRLREQARWEVIFWSSQIVLGVILIPWLGAWGFVATVVLGAAMKNVYAHWMTRQYWAPIAAAAIGQLPAGTSRTVRISGLHSVLRNMLSNAATNVDVLLLSLTGHPEVVGLYRVARTLANVPVKIAAPLWLVLRPRLLTAYQADAHGRFCRIVFAAAAVFAAGSAAVTGIAWLIGGTVLARIYGPEYTASLSPMLILIVGSSVFGAVTGWLSFTMIISSRKSLGSALFALQLVLIVVGGLLIAGGTASGMALAVAGCNVIVSAVAWWGLLSGRFRHVAVARRTDRKPSMES
jgi:O-antigen/teichoic acid export membrane protein